MVGGDGNIRSNHGGLVAVFALFCFLLSRYGIFAPAQPVLTVSFTDTVRLSRLNMNSYVPEVRTLKYWRTNIWCLLFGRRRHCFYAPLASATSCFSCLIRYATAVIICLLSYFQLFVVCTFHRWYCLPYPFHIVV